MLVNLNLVYPLSGSKFRDGILLGRKVFSLGFYLCLRELGTGGKGLVGICGIRGLIGLCRLSCQLCIC